MTRTEIVARVQKQAALDNGATPGVRRLATEAGIKQHVWKKFWPKYGDLLTEAGLARNNLEEGWSHAELCSFLIDLARNLSHFPSSGEIRAHKAMHPDFPNHRVFDRRIGRRKELIEAVREHGERLAMDDVMAMCAEATAGLITKATEDHDQDAEGDVYLLKSGRYFKIGFSVHAGARERQLQIQLPQPAHLIHIIKTDDPRGIEAYWHQRFASKRRNGEWFELTVDDIRTFKKRKTM